MILDPAVTQVIIAIIVNIPIWYVMRSTLQKQQGDAYQALSDALKASGETIEDLIKSLAEMPALRQELAQVKSDWKDDNSGAWELHNQVLDEFGGHPVYRPRKKYQTQPLGKMQT